MGFELPNSSNQALHFLMTRCGILSWPGLPISPMGLSFVYTVYDCEGARFQVKSLLCSCSRPEHLGAR